MPFRIGTSGENCFDYLAVDIGEAAVDAVVADGQPFVIDAHEMQNRRMQIMYGDGCFCLPGPRIALTIADTGLKAGASHPGDERTAIVITPSAALRSA